MRSVAFAEALPQLRSELCTLADAASRCAQAAPTSAAAEPPEEESSIDQEQADERARAQSSVAGALGEVLAEGNFNFHSNESLHRLSLYASKYSPQTIDFDNELTVLSTALLDAGFRRPKTTPPLAAAAPVTANELASRPPVPGPPRGLTIVPNRGIEVCRLHDALEPQAVSATTSAPTVLQDSPLPPDADQTVALQQAAAVFAAAAAATAGDANAAAGGGRPAESAAPTRASKRLSRGHHQPAIGPSGWLAGSEFDQQYMSVKASAEDDAAAWVVPSAVVLSFRQMITGRAPSRSGESERPGADGHAGAAASAAQLTSDYELPMMLGSDPATEERAAAWIKSVGLHSLCPWESQSEEDWTPPNQRPVASVSDDCPSSSHSA
uniref:Uncharacterized protein n=1 Tax=Cafeteria roenbergensis TaxID=33653 RepID=A0A7S0JYU3_CAFRO